jgi:FKBP-type peptidyl-prolyl cis-trans isomerase (trigger factor)
MVAQSKIKYPAIMLEEQLDDMVADMERQLKRQEKDLESYLSLSGQTREDFRAGLKPRGERNLHRSLVLGEITGKEKIRVSPNEFQQEYARMADAYAQAGAPAEIVQSEEFQRRIFSDLLTQRTLARITEIATGRAPSLDEENPESKDEPEDASPAVQETAS